MKKWKNIPFLVFYRIEILIFPLQSSGSMSSWQCSACLVAGRPTKLEPPDVDVCSSVDCQLPRFVCGFTQRRVRKATVFFTPPATENKVDIGSQTKCTQDDDDTQQETRKVCVAKCIESSLDAIPVSVSLSAGSEAISEASSEESSEAISEASSEESSEASSESDIDEECGDEAKVPKERKEPKGRNEPKGPKELKELKEPKERKEPKEPKEPKGLKGLKGRNGPKERKERKERKECKERKERKERKGKDTFHDTHPVDTGGNSLVSLCLSHLCLTACLTCPWFPGGIFEDDASQFDLDLFSALCDGLVSSPPPEGSPPDIWTPSHYHILGLMGVPNTPDPPMRHSSINMALAQLIDEF